MQIEIPELCLVLLIGPSASGKTSFARRHFQPTEVISSDYCRAILADDENDQEVTKEAFDLLHTIVAKRLKLGRLVVVDATSVRPEARKSLIALAKEHNVFTEAIVFDLPENVLLERHQKRTDRPFADQFIRTQRQLLNKSMRHLEREGIRRVHVLKSEDEVNEAIVTRQRLWVNRRHETGPFDIIGDVHGCFDELVELLERLGYQLAQQGGRHILSHPEGRKPIFVGDLVDRGPKTPEVVALVRDLVAAEAALCVLGNHDAKLAKALQGRKANPAHGLAESLTQFAEKTDAERQAAAEFLDGLISHYVLDSGHLVVAHAGIPEHMHGRTSGRVRGHCLYGETTGETDEFGLPVRYNWAKDYRGKACVVYGHTPVPNAEWINNTICLDTGAVFGGNLTALRYPERELVSVPAMREYYAPIRPLSEPAAPLRAQQLADDLLDISDVAGKRFIDTRLRGRIAVPEENAAAALETMSRFAVDPRWLVYLPPTMSPSETSKLPGLLEHPLDAFRYYQKEGVAQVVCEEKHMGSRAVVIVCRDAEAALLRFGVESASGIVLTRTGRRFFDPGRMGSLEDALLNRLREGLDRTGFWDEFKTDWCLLDAELMPWSAKAMDLIKDQYAPVGAAGDAMLSAAMTAIGEAERRGMPVADLATKTATRRAAVDAYRSAYGRYCWDIAGLGDLKLAPFHLMATEQGLHIDRTHEWHMAIFNRLAATIPDLVMATAHRIVDLRDQQQIDAAVKWWEELTAQGGEGMVVKPLDFIVQGRHGLLQPAIKCRGAEYLRIIYGPEYLLPENLERLRDRSLAGKRKLALQEFALGIEGLERFVRREPLRKVHECAFAVLALESEPIDPRL